MKDRIALCWKCKIFYAIVIAFLVGIFILLYRVSTPVTPDVIAAACQQGQQAGSHSIEYGATYDLFNKHFTLLFTVFGTLISLFGVVVPLAFYFFQQKQFRAEIIRISHDFKTRQNNLEQKLSNINTKQFENFSKCIVKQREELKKAIEKQNLELNANFEKQRKEMEYLEKNLLGVSCEEYITSAMQIWRIACVESINSSMTQEEYEENKYVVLHLLTSAFFFAYRAKNFHNMNHALDNLNSFLNGQEVKFNDEKDIPRMVYPQDMDKLMARNTPLYQKYKEVYSKIAPWMFEE